MDNKFDKKHGSIIESKNDKKKDNIKNNKTYFLRENVNREDCFNLLLNYFTSIKSSKAVEQEYFGTNYDGWVVQSLYSFLGIQKERHSTYVTKEEFLVVFENKKELFETMIELIESWK